MAVAVKERVTGLTEAVALIRDGDTVAIGGSLLRRHPMAIIHEMIRQRKRDLRLIGWNNAIDMDLLIGVGSVQAVETSYVGMGMFGLARHYRRAVEAGSLRVVEHSETTAIDAFRAGSMGWSFFPTKTPLGTGLLQHNPKVRMTTCPYTGEPWALMPAFKPDVAILHMHSADRLGNVQLDQRRELDNEVDALMGKAARTTIVTVEQIVSEEYVMHHPHLTVLPRFFVTAVVEAPYGAHPTACDCRYDYDLAFIREYHEATATPEGFQAWLDRSVLGVREHRGYLERLGIRRLMDLTWPREH